MSSPADLLNLERRLAALEERVGETLREPSVAAIAFDAAALTRLSVREILRTVNPRGRISRARFAVSWVARRATEASYPQIAALLSLRNHTSILYHEKQAEILRATDAHFKLLTDQLLKDARDRQDAFIARLGGIPEAADG